MLQFMDRFLSSDNAIILSVWDRNSILACSPTSMTKTWHTLTVYLGMHSNNLSLCLFLVISYFIKYGCLSEINVLIALCLYCANKDIVKKSIIMSTFLFV